MTGCIITRRVTAASQHELLDADMHTAIRLQAATQAPEWCWQRGAGETSHTRVVHLLVVVPVSTTLLNGWYWFRLVDCHVLSGEVLVSRQCLLSCVCVCVCVVAALWLEPCHKQLVVNVSTVRGKACGSPIHPAAQAVAVCLHVFI